MIRELIIKKIIKHFHKHKSLYVVIDVVDEEKSTAVIPFNRIYISHSIKLRRSNK